MPLLGSGRSPGEAHGYLLQYSRLKTSVDRGAWKVTVHGVAKSWPRLSDSHTHTYTLLSGSRAAKAFPTPPVGDECFSPTPSSSSLQGTISHLPSRAEDPLGFSDLLSSAVSSKQLTQYFKTNRAVCLGLFPALPWHVHTPAAQPRQPHV